MMPQEETFEFRELAVEAKRRPFACADAPAFMSTGTREHLVRSDDTPRLMLGEGAGRKTFARLARSTDGE